jgi:hypothetical protein
MSVRFTQRRVDQSETFFVGYFEDFEDFFWFHSASFNGCDTKHISDTLYEQGSFLFIDDESQIEYFLEDDV